MPKYYKPIADNRKARFDFVILEVYKAGLILTGNEVKSVRLGNLNLKDSFCKIQNGEILVHNLHISPYSKADQNKVNPMRERKLLLNKRELVKLVGKVSEKGLTLIPLKVYFDGNWAKIDVGLAKPKKTFEKRETLKARVIKREIDQAFKGKSYDRKDK